MYSLSHAILVVLISIFAGTVSLKLSAFSLACHLLCAKINFKLTCSVKLDVLLLPCPFTCVKLDFVHTCRLDLDVIRLPCSSRTFDLNLPLLRV